MLFNSWKINDVEYVLSTIFMNGKTIYVNMANIVMKSSLQVTKTPRLNSHETSLNSTRVHGLFYMAGGL